MSTPCPRCGGDTVHSLGPGHWFSVACCRCGLLEEGTFSPANILVSNISDCYRLWDGSEKGWVLWRHDEDRVKMTLHFPVTGVTLADIKRIRAAIPKFAEKPVMELVREIKGLPTIYLSDFEDREASRFSSALRKVGLSPTKDCYHITRHIFTNELNGATLNFADEEFLATAIAEAIKRGVPIRVSTC
jgi:hypothetical protein